MASKTLLNLRVCKASGRSEFDQVALRITYLPVFLVRPRARDDLFMILSKGSFGI